MIQLISLISIIAAISLLLFIANFILSKKKFLRKEKISPFECGFNPISRARIPFRIQFFIIRLIFLIFDIEIVLLLPLIIISINFNPYIITYSFIFLFILITGLYLEYNEYSIDWKL